MTSAPFSDATDLEALQETISLFGDAEVLESLRTSRREAAAGLATPLLQNSPNTSVRGGDDRSLTGGTFSDLPRTSIDGPTQPLLDDLRSER